jgi:hypothetical protein
MNDRFFLKSCSAVVLGALLFLSAPLKSISQVESQNPSSESVEYILEDIQGNVQVLEEGATQWEQAEEGQVLESGDEIKVDNKGQATLMLQSETSVHLNGPSDLKVEQISANENGGFLSRLKVFAGLVLADVKKNLQESHSTFEVESNGVVCGVRGTAFEVNGNENTAEISTYEGKVEVGNGSESHMVTAGNFSSFDHGKFRLQRRLDRLEMQRFQKWRSFRQQVMKKRLIRLAALRNHKIQPWHRKHPHHLKRELEKRKKLNHLAR